ncbi:hypothetical protein [Streptomyces malaysiensis]
MAIRTSKDLARVAAVVHHVAGTMRTDGTAVAAKLLLDSSTPRRLRLADEGRHPRRRNPLARPPAFDPAQMG